MSILPTDTLQNEKSKKKSFPIDLDNPDIWQLPLQGGAGNTKLGNWSWYIKGNNLIKINVLSVLLICLVFYIQ